MQSRLQTIKFIYEFLHLSHWISSNIFFLSFFFEFFLILYYLIVTLITIHISPIQLGTYYNSRRDNFLKYLFIYLFRVEVETECGSNIGSEIILCTYQNIVDGNFKGAFQSNHECLSHNLISGITKIHKLINMLNFVSI